MWAPGHIVSEAASPLLSQKKTAVTGGGGAWLFGEQSHLLHVEEVRGAGWGWRERESGSESLYFLPHLALHELRYPANEGEKQENSPITLLADHRAPSSYRDPQANALVLPGAS